VKTYPLQNGQGGLNAFEISNWCFPSAGSVARFFARCPGVELRQVRGLLRKNEEVYVQFELDGVLFDIWKAYGDGSRFWIGPTDRGSRSESAVAQLEQFVAHNWPGPVSKAYDALVNRFPSH